LLTEVAVAWNLALAVPGDTVTVAGTVTAELFVAKFTVNPPLAVALNVTVQLSVPPPVNAALEQLNPFNTGATGLFGAAASSCSANVSVAPPALAARVAIWAVLTDVIVALNLAAAAPGPTITVAGTVTAGLLLAKFTVIPPLAAALKITMQLSVPAPVNESFPQLSRLSTGEVRLVGDTAVSSRAKFSFTLPALAVSVTTCAAFTEATLAVNPALVAPAGTVTEAGTVTARLLLARFTVCPPLAAAAFKVTVQLSTPVPVQDVLPQISPLNPAVVLAVSPVPRRLTCVAPLGDALLTIVSCPFAAPCEAGEK
jgi:hypothetical protein